MVYHHPTWGWAVVPGHMAGQPAPLAQKGLRVQGDWGGSSLQERHSELRTSAPGLCWTQEVDWKSRDGGPGDAFKQQETRGPGWRGHTDASSCPSAWSPHYRGQVAERGPPALSPGQLGFHRQLLGQFWVLLGRESRGTPFCSRTESRLQGVIQEVGAVCHTLSTSPPPVNLEAGPPQLTGH